MPQARYHTRKEEMVKKDKGRDKFIATRLHPNSSDSSRTIQAFPHKSTDEPPADSDEKWAFGLRLTGDFSYYRLVAKIELPSPTLLLWKFFSRGCSLSFKDRIVFFALITSGDDGDPEQRDGRAIPMTE